MLTADPVLAKRIRAYSRFGNLNGRDFGLNYKLGALPAAIGANRLPYLDEQLAKRRANAERLLSQLDHPQVRESTVIDGGRTNYYFLNLRLSFDDNKKFIDYLDANGVPSDIKRYGCCCLYEFPALQEFRRDCINGAALLGSMTTIPVHPDLGPADMDHIAGLINGYRETAPDFA